jgi:hypothetical protein
VAGWIRQIEKKLIYHIGSRTHELQTCSILPTACLITEVPCYKFGQKKNYFLKEYFQCFAQSVRAIYRGHTQSINPTRSVLRYTRRYITSAAETASPFSLQPLLRLGSHCIWCRRVTDPDCRRASCLCFGSCASFRALSASSSPLPTPEIRQQVESSSLGPAVHRRKLLLRVYSPQKETVSTSQQAHRRKLLLRVYSPQKETASTSILHFLLVISLRSAPTLKIKAMRCSETSVNFYSTTQHHIPKLRIN